MKIYITSSTENITENTDLFKKIFSILKGYNYKNTNSYIQQLVSGNINTNLDKDIYQNTISLVKNSDCLIADITKDSISVGALIEVALNNNIPILCLCEENHIKNLPTIIKNKKSNMLCIESYNQQNIAHKISQYFDNFENPTIKFNVFIDRGMDDYLKRSSKKLGISKSEYFRKIIRKEMTKSAGTVK